MWMMTRYGFFSIVRGHGAEAQCLVVRARRRDHLEALCKRFLEPPYHLKRTPRRDYPFRVCITREVAAVLMRELAQDIDYDNFKDEVKKALPADHAYHQFLTKTWVGGLSVSAPGTGGLYDGTFGCGC